MPNFPVETVTAVVAHMNGEHAHDNLLIARAFADPLADSAAMATLDDAGGTWHYTVAGRPATITVPWSARLTERAQIRREIVALYEAACHRTGTVPRPR